MKKINLEQILKNNIGEPSDRDLQTLIDRYATAQDILDAMKEACKQTLKLAANNVRCDAPFGVDVSHIINKQSILDTIDQIE